ncbi:bifunctional adenosylcobinamide kinase/adenosylcobinamide-phosphate guanylyltransferase [Vreelandella malpeensis]|uniref:Bifunctional adenosylcobalamin biosynthesis protein n=1 Tax=Vreelandella malpeensis TaxID=1172368 RepID=A0ABS8DVG3_9GAMM|nr:bifunctional adenosylcobinamide kinase/adenosylcobinamide-phosphate guanylyltransferase [Halomonas malpeensis]MCB8890215.1 bifunctional adenosylcobinamide kinase/adenosylcobinamide-phosphate guanylyltransferase [Halomonas malpeensis]
MIVFVGGGARSGKSRLAESLTLEAAPGRCYYMATASHSDDEMRERIERHQARRDERWVTLEAPLDFEEALATIPRNKAVLLDCLTLWASQLLFAAELSEDEGVARLEKLLREARRRGLSLVVVSNDLNEALLPDDPVVWRFVAFLQRLHRVLAREADSVIEVVAGHGIEWKPRGASKQEAP